MALSGQRDAGVLVELLKGLCQNKDPRSDSSTVRVKKAALGLSLASLFLSISHVTQSDVSLPSQVFSFCLLDCSKTAALPVSLPQ